MSGLAHRRPAKTSAATSAPRVVGPTSFAFGSFVLIPQRQQLLANGAAVKIGGRALDILTLLVQRQGELVSKREIVAHVWPDLVVEAGNLKVNVAALRRVLRDDSQKTPYITTVVGRGYCFAAPVRRVDLDAPPVLVVAPPKRNHNLPARETPVFGRAAAIASILRDLDSSRLVSLVGPGGMGKTTVAMAVAREAAPAWEDGVWFVDLAAVTDGARVSDAVATAIGLSAPLQDSVAVLSSQLRYRKMLLVLDNCEHVIDAVALCASQLLTHAESVRLLTTSREPLCIKGERVRRLSGLATPPDTSALSAEAALEFAAVELFVERARRRSPTFALRDESAAIVGELCRRLDGLALAIECVAARVDTLKVGQLLDHIESDAHLLDCHPTELERHRNLTASIDWSYGLLSETERIVLRRLSSLDGAFTLEAACTAAAKGMPRSAVVDAVVSLTAKSLLAASARDGEMEYRQIHAVRAFAREEQRLDRDRERQNVGPVSRKQ